ncbi:tape measure protein [Rhizobium sp. HT1-10]|uniref:tape measure protein n=1 Tax=Rhizobium sp. HT1-10 TaxID=3111638 RepID=UPI003C23E7A8
MATDEERLIVSLEARINDFEKKMKQAEQTGTRSFTTLQRQSSAATKNMEQDMQRSTARINQALATTTTSIGTFGKAFALTYASISAVKGFANLSDAATKISNSLRTTGLEGAELAGVMDKLFAVAQKNAAPIEALAQLYSRVSVVQAELGVSSEQLIGLTDNVGKSLKITGTSAEEASGTLLQLAQAFGGNKIQAQEYNSLIDGALPLLKAAAAGIKQAGGSVSTLTALVKDGKISNKAFFDGIEAGSFILDRQLGGATLTVGQSMTNLQTALIKATGKFNEQTGAASGLALEIQKIADAIPNLKFDGVVGGIDLITNAVLTAIAKVDGLYGALTKLAGFNVGDLLGKGGDRGDANPSLMELGQKTSDQQLTDLADQRLRIERQIADIKSQGLDDIDAGKGALAQYKADLDTIDKQVGAIKQSVRDTKDAALIPPVVASIAHPQSKVVTTQVDDSKAGSVDITDTKYTPKGDPTKKASGGKGTKSDPFASEVEAIRRRTDATNAETAAQAKLNPLIDDYGFAVAKAKQQSMLETAAKEANTKAKINNGQVTEKQTAQIEALSTAYADSVAAANRLDDAQQKIVERQRELVETSKDVTRGIVDGFAQGESAANVFKDALGKIASKLEDLAFDSIFSTGKGGGGLGGIISSLFGGGGSSGAASSFMSGGFDLGLPKLAKGGVQNRPSIFAEAGPEAAVPLPDGRRIPVDLGKGSAGMTVTATYAPTIHFTGTSQEIANLQAVMAKDRSEFGAKTIATIRDATKRRII